MFMSRSVIPVTLALAGALVSACGLQATQVADLAGTGRGPAQGVDLPAKTKAGTESGAATIAVILQGKEGVSEADATPRPWPTLGPPPTPAPLPTKLPKTSTGSGVATAPGR